METIILFLLLSHYQMKGYCYDNIEFRYTCDATLDRVVCEIVLLFTTKFTAKSVRLGESLKKFKFIFFLKNLFLYIFFYFVLPRAKNCRCLIEGIAVITFDSRGYRCIWFGSSVRSIVPLPRDFPECCYFAEKAKTV